MDNFERNTEKCDKVFVSVIVPVYNAENYLSECIDSLFGQTLKNVEFIFVNDGSSDNSLEILQQYSKKDDRIQVYTQENQHAGVARNFGMSKAKGEYITFLDSDDIMLPDALELLYKKAKDSAADIVMGKACSFGKDVMQRRMLVSAFNDKYLPTDEVFSCHTHSKYFFQITAGAPWGKIYRTAFIREHDIQFPPLPRTEDIAFVFAAMIRAKIITTVRETLIYYRENIGSGSLEDSKDIHPLTICAACHILAEDIKDFGAWEQLKQSFVNYVLRSIIYNLQTFRTGEAFQVLADYVRNEFTQEYGVDLYDTDYFYLQNDLKYIKRIYEEVPINYVYSQYRYNKTQADKYRAELKKMRSSPDFMMAQNCGKITRYANLVEIGLRSLKRDGFTATLRKTIHRIRKHFDI